MLKLFVIGAIISTVVLCIKEDSFRAQNVTGKRFIYNTTTYDKVIKVTVNDTTTQILDFTEDSEKLLGYPTRVHVAINDSIRSDYPLFVTAEQQKGVSSWELPLVVATKHAVLQFDDMARTLCPHDAGPNITSQGRPTVTLATASPENISVTIKLRRVTDFYLEVNKEVQLNVTPSTPKYYYFSFANDPVNVTGSNGRFNYTIPKSVLLTMDSDDNDICAVVSIQNNSCPVFDNEKDILYTGYHFTMLSKGGITVTSTMFPKGFYVVLIVKENDEECTGVNGVEGAGNDSWTRLANPAARVKNFRSGHASPDSLLHPIARAAGFYVVLIVKENDEECTGVNGVEGGAGNDSWTRLADPAARGKHFRLKVVPAASYTDYITGALATIALMLLIAILGPLAAFLKCSCREEVVMIEEAPGPSTSGTSASADSAPIVNNQDSGDSDAGSDDEFQQKTLPLPLNLAGLSRARHTAHIRRSDRYFWSALTVAVVYALPVVQLLLTYQRMVFQTGDQDVCYYNFLCAHPLGPLSDFNHVFTNIGYVILGLAFTLQTRCRQMRGHQYQDRGIPQHHGLFYSMGLALIMEGVLSACYHLCPNKMNFQFDSSFMYVIAVLCIIKLYQSRHPDVNASAHATFMLIALVMAIGLFGIMYPSVGFWALFTILHLSVTFVLALKIYYVGRFKMEKAVATRAWSAVKEQGWVAFKPNYTARAILIAVAILANCIVAGYGVYEHKTDFARHLLVILMGNAILYTSGYVIMKLFHGEQLRAPAVLYLLLAVVSWSLAAHLFLLARTKWSQMPAVSRSHNAPCAALNMFDTHDLWHLASAAAIFFSFNALLVLDDPLIYVPRDRIPVF